jgi:hypothetical protein
MLSYCFTTYLDQIIMTRSLEQGREEHLLGAAAGTNQVEGAMEVRRSVLRNVRAENLY